MAQTICLRIQVGTQIYITSSCSIADYFTNIIQALLNSDNLFFHSFYPLLIRVPNLLFTPYLLYLKKRKRRKKITHSFCTFLLRQHFVFELITLNIADWSFSNNVTFLGIFHQNIYCLVPISIQLVINFHTGARTLASPQ